MEHSLANPKRSARYPAAANLISYALLALGCLLFVAYFLIPEQRIEGSVDGAQIEERSSGFSQFTLPKPHSGLFRAVADGRVVDGSASITFGAQVLRSTVNSTNRLRDTAPILLHRVRSDGSQRLMFVPPEGQSVPADGVAYELLLLANPMMLYLALGFLTLGGCLAQPGQAQARAKTGFAMLLLVSCYAVLFLKAIPEIDSLSNDSRQNVSAMQSLNETGVYQVVLKDDSVSYMYREPFFAYYTYVAASLLRVDLGDPECTREKNLSAEKRQACADVFTNIVKLQLPFWFAAVLGAGLVVQVVLGNALLSFGAIHLSALSWTFQLSSSRALSELHAGALMVFLALFCVLAFKNKALPAFFAAGLSAGFLGITKVIFSPIIVVLLVTFGVLLAFQTSRKRLWVSLLVLTLGYAGPVGFWMGRNAIVANDFAIVDARSVGVVNVRSAMNQMTPQEYRAGFYYYTPHIKPRMEEYGIPLEHYTRFDTSNKDGFRLSEQKRYRAELSRLLSAADQSGEQESRLSEDVSKASDQVAGEAVADIRKNIWGHAKVSLLLAYRGVFIDRGFGLLASPDSDAKRQNLSARALRFSQEQSTLFNLSAALSLLLAPLLAALLYRRRALLIGLAVLPALYCHAIYALVSHFNIRYAVPELPLRYVALMLVLGCLAHVVMRVLRPVLHRPAP